LLPGKQQYPTVLNPLMLKLLLYITVFNFLTITALCQDTLPNMKARIRSGKVIVSWVNPFKDVVLINIQRSTDSLRNFKTILTVADPGAVTNGYLDAKAPDTKQYYRLFVQQEGGRYFFSQSYKPFVDTAKPKPKKVAATATRETPVKETSPPVAKEQTATRSSLDLPKETTTAIIIAPSTTVESTGAEGTYKPEKNDTQKIKFSNSSTIGRDSAKIGSGSVKDFKPPPVLIYSNSQGQVIIVLPDEKKTVYTLKFFTDAGEPVFTLNKIRESHLTIEKTNFHHSGWYRCELYEQDKLREKYRVFISKD